MNLPPLFAPQFFRPAVDGVAQVAAGCRLYTRPAGTPAGTQASYTTAAGDVPNTNPILLDDDGRCDLWLNPATPYLLELRGPVIEGEAVIDQWDNVNGAAVALGIVTSVNEETGDVTLDAGDIPYTTSSDATWLTADTVEAALDQITDRADSPPASAVTLADGGGLFAASNVEDALAELAGSSALPVRTGKDGRVLGLVSGALAWVWPYNTHMLHVTDGSAASRDVILQAGTWRIALDSRAYFDTPTTVVSATQAATVGGQTVTCTINFSRTGDSGHGYLIHGSDIAIGELVVGSEATYTMSIAAMTLNGAVAKGTVMTLHKVA